MWHLRHKAMVEATTLLLVVITVLTTFFVWSRRTYVYWQRRRINFVQPTHLLGNLKEVLKLQTSFALQLRNFYFDERFRNDALIGIYLFHQPGLLIRDLTLVRTVLINDFSSFSNRFSKCDPHQDKMGALSLFFVKNPAWRDIRNKMAPVFSNGKLKLMFELMEEIGCDLERYLNNITDFQHNDVPEHVDDDEFDTESDAIETDFVQYEECARIVQIKEICNYFATDMISSIGFGMRSNCLRHMHSEIGLHSRQMFILSLRRAIDFCVIFFLPKLVPLLRPKLFTLEHADFLRRTVLRVIEERERSGHLRNDLIEMLLTFKKEADLHPDRTHFTQNLDYLAAQAAAFEIAGTETSSATLAFALYELAKQPALQDRLRSEILANYASCCGSLSYECVAEMKYLSMVVAETLRMYPIVPFLERECTPVNKKRYYSFRPYVNCMARRGMPIYISNFAIHYDPNYWPNPNDFDPERFSPENLLTQTPMSYLPFGAGPHNCVAMSVGQLQIKLGLIHFLKNHRVEFCDKTVKNIKFDPKFALLSVEGGIYLKVVRCL